MSEKNDNIVSLEWNCDSRIPHYATIDLADLRQCHEEGDFSTREELADYLEEVAVDDFNQRYGVNVEYDSFIDEHFPELPG